MAEASRFSGRLAVGNRAGATGKRVDRAMDPPLDIEEYQKTGGRTGEIRERLQTPNRSLQPIMISPL